MSKDISAVAVVSYVKHWDNDTKGTMEFPSDDLEDAIMRAKINLRIDAVQDGLGEKENSELFTITKATWGVPSNWIGV